MIKYLKGLCIPFISIIIMSICASIGNLFMLTLPVKVIYISMIIVMFICGYYSSKNNNNAYLNGLIVGILTSILMFLISLIYHPTYNILSIIYYIVIIVFSMIGAMVSNFKH